MSANLTPLRDWYREHAPMVQLDSTRWAAALHAHTLDELTLAVELLDLPDGNLPTPALMNELLAEVRSAAHEVERKTAAARGFAEYKAARDARRAS